MCRTVRCACWCGRICHTQLHIKMAAYGGGLKCERRVDMRMEKPEWPEVFYINLDHRGDRRESVLSELRKVGYPEHKIHRVDAVRKENGALGCGLSHIKALREVRERGLEQAIILEDDFVWREAPAVTRDTLSGALRGDWDVCLLSCHGELAADTGQEALRGVKSCQTTSGYMVRPGGIEPLLEVFEETVNQPENEDTFEASLIASNHIDQRWKALQGGPGWRATAPLLGRQMDGYSDITQQEESYMV